MKELLSEQVSAVVSPQFAVPEICFNFFFSSGLKERNLSSFCDRWDKGNKSVDGPLERKRNEIKAMNLVQPGFPSNSVACFHVNLT